MMRDEVSGHFVVDENKRGIFNTKAQRKTKRPQRRLQDAEKKEERIESNIVFPRF